MVDKKKKINISSNLSTHRALCFVQTEIPFNQLFVCCHFDSLTTQDQLLTNLCPEKCFHEFFDIIIMRRSSASSGGKKNRTQILFCLSNCLSSTAALILSTGFLFHRPMTTICAQPAIVFVIDYHPVAGEENTFSGPWRWKK